MKSETLTFCCLRNSFQVDLVLTVHPAVNVFRTKHKLYLTTRRDAILLFKPSERLIDAVTDHSVRSQSVFLGCILDSCLGIAFRTAC